MMRRAFFLSILALALACDDDGSTSPEPDAGRDAAAEADSGAPDAGADAGSDAGEPSCEVGAQVTGSFGPSGGSVSLCGATMAFDEGVLTEERGVTLSIVPLPAPAPYPLEAGGLAFHVDVEGDIPTSTPLGPLSVSVPHEATTRYRHLFRYDPTEGWQGIESCPELETAIGQKMYVDGTYVALIDTEDFPDSVDSLGSGSMESTFDATTTTFDLASSEFNTYAIYDQGEDGSRNFAISATKPVDTSTLYVQAKFGVDAAGTPTLIEVTYGEIGGGGLWSFNPFQGTTPTITLTTNDGNHVAGSFEAVMQMGPPEEAMMEMLSVTFDATAGKFRYPPEGFCELPEG